MESLGSCGLGAIEGSLPSIVRQGEKAGLHGVQRCKSAWTCPHCAPNLAATRANNLRPQIARYVRQGWQPWLLTLTLRHHKGSNLDAMFELLSKTWSRLTSGKEWAALKASGVEYIRGYDQTYGEQHAWHPHLHSVFLFSPAVADPAAVAQRLLDRWISIIRTLGGDAVADGLDAEPCRDVDQVVKYVSHMAGVWEAAAGVKKQSKTVASRTVMDLAHQAAAGDEVAAGLWSQYALATKGRRAIAVSQGLSLSDVGEAIEEQAEIEAREAEINGDPAPVEVVAVIYPAFLVKADPHMGELLAAAGRSAEECRRLLVHLLGPPEIGHWVIPLQ